MKADVCVWETCGCFSSHFPPGGSVFNEKKPVRSLLSSILVLFLKIDLILVKRKRLKIKNMLNCRKKKSVKCCWKSNENVCPEFPCYPVTWWYFSPYQVISAAGSRQVSSHQDLSHKNRIILSGWRYSFIDLPAPRSAFRKSHRGKFFFENFYS